MTDLNYKTEIDIYAGSFEIFIFTLDLKNHNTDQISFPPNGFKISKVVWSLRQIHIINSIIINDPTLGWLFSTVRCDA